jgi:hypothetical protein
MKPSTICILLAAAFVPAPAVIAQDKAQTQAQTQTRDIYGYQMMTPQERDEYRAKMRVAQTQEERERIRTEHHALMKERAKERGITMPDQPPAHGMGGGMGSSGGMGPGGGMGRGK